MAEDNLRLLPRLIRGTAAHGMGGIVSALVNFTLLFLYSVYLTPETYGVLAILLIIQVFCEVFPSLGMNGSIMMLYYKKESPEAKAKLIGTTMMATIGMSVVVGLLMLPGSNLLANIIFDDSEVSLFIFIAALCGVLQNSITFPKVYFRILEMDLKHAKMDIAQAVLKFISVYYFLVIADMGLLGVLAGTLLSLVFMWAYLHFPLLKYIKLGFEASDFKVLISLGWPLIFAWVANWGLNSLDRLFLNHYIDLTTVGVYAFAFQLAMALRVVLVAPVEKIWPSMLFQTEDNEHMKKRYKGVMSLFLMGSCLAVTTLVFYADELYYFFLNEKYHESRKYLSMACIAPMLMGLNVLISSGARLKRKMTFFPKALFVTVAVGFILNYIFVQQWGGMGIATATILTLAIMNLIYYFYSQSVHPIDFGSKALILASAYLAALTMLHIQIFDLNWLQSLSTAQVLQATAIKTLLLSVASYFIYKRAKGFQL